MSSGSNSEHSRPCQPKKASAQTINCTQHACFGHMLLHRFSYDMRQDQIGRNIERWGNI